MFWFSTFSCLDQRSITYRNPVQVAHCLRPADWRVACATAGDVVEGKTARFAATVSYRPLCECGYLLELIWHNLIYKLCNEHIKSRDNLKGLRLIPHSSESN